MRRWMTIGAAICLLMTLTGAGARSADESNQLLMRDKLMQVNRVLEGITLDEYEQVQEAAKTLKAISPATG